MPSSSVSAIKVIRRVATSGQLTLDLLILPVRHTELENGGRKHHEDDSVDGSEDLVPIERLGKGSRHLVKYWRFLGFKVRLDSL